MPLHRVSRFATVPDLPPPVEFGFSGKFSTWRPAQIQALDAIATSTARVIGVVAPCGFGKALFGMAAVQWLGAERAAYLTSTRGLQDQAVRDFTSLGLVDVRGQQNYPCIALEPGSALARYRNRRKHEATCEDGPCHAGVQCHHAPDPKQRDQEPYCGYYRQVWRAQRARLINSNYAYWMAATNYGQGLGDLDLLVLDEAHEAERELERWLVCELSTEDAGRVNGRLLASTGTAEWATWAADHNHRLADRLEYLALRPPQTGEEITERRRLTALKGTLERLAGMDPAGWIVERDQWKVRFSPLDVRAYVESSLLHGVPRVLCMSATLTPKTLENLGFPDAELWEFPSTFPVARRPVYACNSIIEVRVGPNMTEQDRELWLERIDAFIDTRRHLKGVIHSVSYERGQYLYEHSRHRDLMLWHAKGDAQVGVEALKLHDGPAILVSPSIMTGIDLPGDECRYQIIAKIPIPDPRGPIMQARIAADKSYSWYVAAQKLEQAVGRGMRAEDDWCETFIADDTFGAWFFDRASRFMTEHFRESVIFAPQCPPTLSLSEGETRDPLADLAEMHE